MTGSAVPGGAPSPADQPRPGLRARLSSLQGHDTLCLPVGEIRDLVAALDAARADVETLEASHRRLLHAQGLIATEIGRVSLALRRAAGAVVPDPEETP